MPKIDTSKGPLNYKPFPFFTGMFLLDKTIQEENLLIIKKIFDDNNVPFLLAAGTLLGAVREKDFIEHDDDIDLAIDIKYMPKVKDLLWDLLKEGFEVARYDRQCIISVLRKGQYVDFAFFADYDAQMVSCSGWIMYKDFLRKTTSIEFLGQNYLCPEDYEGYLVSEFGNSWKTPIRYYNYNQPKIVIYIKKKAEIIKAYLPDFLYFPLKRRAEKKTANAYYKRVTNNIKNRI